MFLSIRGHYLLHATIRVQWPRRVYEYRDSRDPTVIKTPRLMLQRKRGKSILEAPCLILLTGTAVEVFEMNVGRSVSDTPEPAPTCTYLPGRGTPRPEQRGICARIVKARVLRAVP